MESLTLVFYGQGLHKLFQGTLMLFFYQNELNAFWFWTVGLQQNCKTLFMCIVTMTKLS